MKISPYRSYDYRSYDYGGDYDARKLVSINDDAAEDCEYYADGDLEATFDRSASVFFSFFKVYFSDSLKCISFVLMVICFLEAAQ